MPGRTLTWVVLAAVVLVVLLAGGTGVFAKVRDLPERVDEAGSSAGAGQSASQISEAEFGEVLLGTSPGALRALVGEPEEKARHEVEGLAIECWYYGAGSKTGVYQFCFRNGRLTSKLEYR